MSDYNWFRDEGRDQRSGNLAGTLILAALAALVWVLLLGDGS